MKLPQWTWLAAIGVLSIVIVALIYFVTGVPIDTPLSGNLANSFLGTIAQVLAGVLAIVLSLSVLAVEIASDKYTSRLFSYFRRDWTTWAIILCFLACIVISVVAMGIQTVPMYQWGFLAMSGFFVLSLMLLLYYFDRTLRLLDPRDLAHRIRNEALQALHGRHMREAREAIASLGDVAVTAFERGEDEITQRCLDALYEIERTRADTCSPQILGGGEEIGAAVFWKSSNPSSVVDQYYRVFKMAGENGNYGVTRHVANLLHMIIAQLLDQTTGTEALGRILWQQYYEFVETAVSNGDTSRFALVLSLRDFILRPSCRDEQQRVCLATLHQVNKTIIVQGDFELWKEELHRFSRVPSLENAFDLLQSSMFELLDKLKEKKIPVSNAQWQKWCRMVESMRTRLTHTNKRVFEAGLSEIEQLIPPSEQGLREPVDRVRWRLQQLSALTGVFDIFFRCCLDALFKKHYRYVKELWRHVDPFDTSVHWANTNLVHLNVGFLTHQMLAFSWPSWDIEHYHSAEPYVYQYYLLCLAYALEQATSDWHPAIPHFSEALLSQGDDYSIALGEDLRATHTFLINLPHHADKALVQYEAVAEMIKQWDDVFGGRASAALEKSKNWLTDPQRRQEWEDKADGIVRNLPLDGSRVNAYKVKALEYYQLRTVIGQLAMSEQREARGSTELRRGFVFDSKREFTVIGYSRPDEIGGRVGFPAVEYLVKAEINHITSIILKQREIKRTKAKQLSFSKVTETAGAVREAGYEASVLLASSQQIACAWQDDHDFRTSLVSEGSQRYLKLDESTRLSILEVDGDYALVLDENAGSWTTVNPPDVEVAMCEKDPLKVESIARETVDYQVLNPEAVRIIEFGQPESESSR